MNSNSISVRAFMVLVIMFTIGTSILIAPAGLALLGHQDAWMSSIIGIAANGVFLVLYIALEKQGRDKSIIELSLSAFGKWIGGLLGFAFIAFFHLLAALMVGDLGFFLTTQIVPETPIEVLQLLFVIVVLFAARAGAVVYARAAEIFFPLLVCMFILLILSMIPIMDHRNFLPMLEFGVKPVLKGSFSYIGLQETVVLLMLYPYVNKTGGRNKAMAIGLLIGGIFLVVTTVCCIGVMGASVTANQQFPAYVLAKKISIGHFLERIEGVMMFIWVLTIAVKVIITFDAAARGLAQLTRAKDSRPFILPMGFGLIVLSLICYPNSVFVNNFLAKNWTPFALIFMLFIPLLLLVVLAVKNHFEESKLSNPTAETEDY
ncbi:endospore germination permease [Paenibacillus sp. NPDC058071]|uniref:GerAB/ArcD/ProY family transporter n=1 Tax=Paenibacillus sp. NPDC058071 TaxID=3346326 RepID=UPI0036DF602F